MAPRVIIIQGDQSAANTMPIKSEDVIWLLLFACHWGHKSWCGQQILRLLRLIRPKAIIIAPLRRTMKGFSSPKSRPSSVAAPPQPMKKLARNPTRRGMCAAWRHSAGVEGNWPFFCLLHEYVSKAKGNTKRSQLICWLRHISLSRLTG